MALAGIFLGYPAALAVGILILFLGVPTIMYLAPFIFPEVKISFPEQSYLTTIGVAVLLSGLAFITAFFYGLSYFLIGLIIAALFKITSKIYYMCCGFIMVVIIMREPTSLDFRYLNWQTLEFSYRDRRTLAGAFCLGAISGLAYWFVAVRPFYDTAPPIARANASESI